MASRLKDAELAAHPCPTPPDPPDATRNQLTLFRGDGWTTCSRTALESSSGTVHVLHRDGEVIAVKKDGRSVAMTAHEQHIARDGVEKDAELVVVLKAIARTSGVLSISEASKTFSYKNRNPGVYKPVWVAGRHLIALLEGREFSRKRTVHEYDTDEDGNRTKESEQVTTTLAMETLMREVDPAAWAWLQICDRQVVIDRLELCLQSVFASPMSWSWWAGFLVKQAWGAFERLGVRSALSYSHDGKRGRSKLSCIRVLAQQTLYPFSPLRLDHVGQVTKETA